MVAGLVSAGIKSMGFSRLSTDTRERLE